MNANASQSTEAYIEMLTQAVELAHENLEYAQKAARRYRRSRNAAVLCAFVWFVLAAWGWSR